MHLERRETTSESKLIFKPFDSLETIFHKMKTLNSKPQRIISFKLDLKRMRHSTRQAGFRTVKTRPARGEVRPCV